MAEFGNLVKVKERRSSITYELSGQTVEDRLNSDSKEFSLESGMIANYYSRKRKESTISSTLWLGN